MTNVDFFRDFAADTTSKKNVYYFEHSRETLDFSNLFDADSAEDDQLKIFHFTDSIEVELNEAGDLVVGVKYSGKILALIKSDLDETVDTQKNTKSEDGKYEKRVKELIEDGGVIAEIISFNNCDTDYDKEISFSDLKEVYNMFDWNGDGVFFKYEVVISV